LVGIKFDFFVCHGRCAASLTALLLLLPLPLLLPQQLRTFSASDLAN